MCIRGMDALLGRRQVADIRPAPVEHILAKLLLPVDEVEALLQLGLTGQQLLALREYPRKSHLLATKHPGHQIAASCDPAKAADLQMQHRKPNAMKQLALGHTAVILCKDR